MLLAPATLVADMAGRVALSEAVVAHKESITLSDFLPPDAPEKLRARAMELKLGEAPLPGARRTFIRAQMEWRLRGAPELRDAIAIPTSIEVTRWSRALTHEEVLVAIEDAMRSNQLAVPVPLLPQDLVFRSNVSVTEAAPKLKVTRIESSSDGAETHVRLSTPSEPHSPAFWVTLLQNGEAPAQNPRPITIALQSNTGAFPQHSNPGEIATRNVRSLAPNEVIVPRSAPPPIRAAKAHSTIESASSALVHVGDRVELILVAQGMRMSVRATALELGSLGQKIRVRNSDSGKVLSGTVVAPRTVEAEF